MDIAVYKVGLPAPVGGFGGVYLAADQPGVAPATFAAAAMGGGGHAAVFHGAQQGLVCGGGEDVFPAGHAYGKPELGGCLFGIVRLLGGIEVFAKHLVADELPAQAQGGYFLIHKVIHCGGAADEYGIVAFGGVFAYKVGGDKAMLPAFNGRTAENIYILEIWAGTLKLFKFVVEEGFLYGIAAVEQYHVGVFVALCHGLCHGAEGGNAAAAGNTYYVLCIPQGLVCKNAQGLGCGHFRAHLPVIQYVL